MHLSLDTQEWDFVNGKSVMIQKVLAKLSLDSHGASRMDGRKNQVA